MVATVISSNVLVAQVMSTGSELVVLEHGSITTISSAAVSPTIATATDIDVFVAGDILASSFGVNLRCDLNGDGTGGASHDVFVNATGSIASLNSHALTLEGNDNIVTNYGEIMTFGSGSSAVNSVGDDFSLRNYGTMMGGEALELLSALANVSEAHVENHGTMQGENRGIDSNIRLVLNNSGSIISTDDDGDSIGIDIGNLNATEFTLGSIINNSGLISGQTEAIKITGQDNIVRNSGNIIGDVEFGDGNDLFDGRGGTIVGSVSGGDGDDVYIVDDATVALVENAGQGTDTVKSEATFTLGANFENLELIGAADVAAVGNGTDNTLIGNMGNNWVRGGAGNDFMGGGTGDDVLLGSAGTDTIFGGADNDRLYGGIGNDTLHGITGDDSLHGGLGADLLFGGSGEDVFEFNRVAQSLKTNNDIIKDFQLNIDAIDLSAFGVAFKTGGFSGTKEVLVTTAAGNNTVWIDTDGNGFADMKILVEGVTGLNVDDLIL